MARPKLNPDYKRSATIHVRVSPIEYASLRSKAAEAHLSPAQLLRHAALSKRMPAPPPTLGNIEKYRELARLSANLNQLAHHANAGHQLVHVNENLLSETIRRVNSLRMSLLAVESQDDRKN